MTTWDTVVVRDENALAGLADEWEALYANSSRATPFQSYGWVASCFRHYAGPGRLRVVTVRREGVLAGVAPLVLHRRAGVRVLSLPGSSLWDVGGVLLDDGAPETGDALACALAALPHWDAVDLARVPAALARRLATVWPGSSWVLPDSPCLDLPIRPVEELVARLPGKTRRHMRYRLRQIVAAGVTTTLTPHDRASTAVRQMLELHRRDWADRNIDPEHESPRFASHLTHAAASMSLKGQAVVQQFWQGERVLGVQLLLVGRSCLGGYLYGVDPEVRHELDVNIMLVRGSVELAAQLGLDTFSMLRGTEPSKMRWSPTVRQTKRVLLTSRTGVGRGYASAVAWRRAAAAYAARVGNRRRTGGRLIRSS